MNAAARGALLALAVGVGACAVVPADPDYAGPYYGPPARVIVAPPPVSVGVGFGWWHPYRYHRW